MTRINRKATTQWLSRMLMRDVLHVPYDNRYYWASEVTLRRKNRQVGESVDIRVDFVQFIPVNQTAGGIDRGEFVCYEIKSCKADFKSTHGHNFIGDKNYYVMPAELYQELQDDDPHLKQLCLKYGGGRRAGVYIPRAGTPIEAEVYEKHYLNDFPSLALFNPTKNQLDDASLTCVRKADVNLERPYSNSEMLFAMLRSAGRDRVQYEKSWWSDASHPQISSTHSQPI